MKFDYKTRGNSSPEGKSRVCIIGHPDDFPLYFEELSNQILSWHNCAIWYTFDEIFALDEDSRFHISQMQLVIVMVTKRFFIERQFCAEAALSLTEALHIPMLPIVFETELDELYAHYYKTMHYISPLTNDTYATDISYDQKLQKFVSRILVTDDDIDNINRAFDASLFISYRKKDREHALRLMKRLHENDYFQSVAIWYDEFLIPGDNFLSGINEKLQACDLFTLVVTPNLLEPGNFVMDVEYKEALSLKKSIFPVEMEATDKQKLAAFFPYIPECVICDGGADFDRQLYDSLRHVLPTTREFSGEKTYYLGLAYLNGINVEINFETALTLLHKSANLGHIAAYEQLITMYREGQGVKRNYQRALEIQDTLILGLYDLYQKNPATPVRNKLHYHLFQIIESYEKDGFVEKTEKYLHIMNQLIDLSQLNSMLASSENKETLGIYTNYLMKYAALHRQRGNTDMARDCYEKCATIRLQLIQWSESLSEQLLRMRAVSTIYLELGDMELNQLNNHDAAEYFYSYTKTLRETIVATVAKGDPAELGYRRDLSNIIWRLGDLMFRKAQLPTSAATEYAFLSYQHFQECLTMRLKLVEEAKTEQSEDEVATAYLGLAKLVLSCHRLLNTSLDAAYFYIQEALAITKRIMNNRMTRQSMKRVARMLEIKASILMNQKNAEAAFLSLKEAQKLLENVVAQYQSSDDIFILSGLYKDAADLFHMMNQPDYAVNYYRKSLALIEALIQAAPNNPYYQKAYQELMNILSTLV